MTTKIKTYNSEDFRKEYLNTSPELDKLFEKSIEDFFCLRIEELTNKVTKPILPSREESHTLIYVTKGSYKTKVGFKEYTVKPNQIVVYQAGAVFSTADLSKRVEGFTCHFSPDTMIGKFGNRSLVLEFDFLLNGNHPIISVSKNMQPAILSIMQRLTSEFKGEGTPNPKVVHSYLFTLLTELKILYGQHKSVGQSAAYQITARFRILVHQHVKDNWKVADYADKMNVSANHLNKSVKSITSKSASELMNEIKLIEIKYLLYQSDLSVSEISYELGFLDPSYFTRFFKKHEGVSPTEYKELIELS